MKTTKVFIGLFLVLAVASLFLSEWLFFGYALVTLIISILLLIEKRKNAQLDSKILGNVEYFIAQENRLKLEIEKDCKEIDSLKESVSSLTSQLETAKANSYHEVERKRCSEKYNRLYKGKKKQVDAEQKNEQPYQIEGKSIKQLVEENLGIEVDGMFLCGYDREFANSDINANWSPFLVGNDKITYSSFHKDKIILKNYSNIEWSDTTYVINAIKKHRNIK